MKRPHHRCVLLVRLRTSAPVLQEALGGGGLVLEARTLLHAFAVLETVRPTAIIVSDSFPHFEVDVLRTKLAIGTLLRFVAADADLQTLIALVDEGLSQRRPPEL